MIWTHDDIAQPSPGEGKCENPFRGPRPAKPRRVAEATTEPVTHVTCKVCRKKVSTDTLSLRTHLRVCRPQAASAIQAEFGERIRAAEREAA